LGADALVGQAVVKIFEVKGRPADNPIIVHIAEVEQLEDLCPNVPESVPPLAQAFWPGPLTLVVPKHEDVPMETTGGLDTVAVRIPDCLVALNLIEALGRPIAAPSANLSGRPSPTAAEHVYEDLNGRIEMILDGGPARIGVESTVLDLTTTPPVILRPGGIAVEELREVIGEVKLTAEAEARRRSPGTRYRHYSPRAPVILIEQWNDGAARQLVQHLAKTVRALGCVGMKRDIDWGECQVRFVELTPDPELYANRIFAILREFDQAGVEAIIVEGIKPIGLGAAVMDRLRRAASRIV
jgi:L-threonylcarbamoyladenylate synthase